MPSRDASPFETLEDAFRVLAAPPAPMLLNGAVLGAGLPQRPIGLPELRRLMLDRRTPTPTKDAVLSYLVLRSNRHGGRWTVALAGLLLPGLRGAVEAFRRHCPSQADDIEAEALAGLLAAIKASPSRHIANRLISRAKASAWRTFHVELSDEQRTAPLGHSLKPALSCEHPDLVLVEAVKARVIGAGDAFLIGETRVAGRPLSAVARSLGLPYAALQKQRRRAEKRLVPWLQGDPVSSWRP